MLERPASMWAALAWGLALPAADAEVVTVTSVADTSLFEWTDDYNFGGEDGLPAGGLGGQAGDLRLARALYKFDVAGAVPAGATIVSARLTLSLIKAPETSRASDFALYRVLVDWGEGDKDAFGDRPGGATATAGEATWLHRFYPDVTCSLPGGQFGVDFAAAQSALASNVDGEGDYVLEMNATGVADLQHALDHPADNHGWVLRSLGEDLRLTARHWASREAPAGTHPELEITWTMETPVPRITSIEADSGTGEVVVRVDALAGYSYQVFTTGNFETWTPGETRVPASDGELSFELAFVEPGQFIRIEATPAP